MKLVGGDLSLDFVNTVGGREPGRPGTAGAVREDKIAGFEDLVAWSVHAAGASKVRARELQQLFARRPIEAAAVVVRARALREALYRVLRAVMEGGRAEAGDLRVLNEEVAAARRQECLVPAVRGLRWEATPREGAL